MKKLISIVLAVAVIFALNITAFAGGFITDESAMSTGAKADPPYAAAADDNAILKENKAYELYANNTRAIYSVSVTPCSADCWLLLRPCLFLHPFENIRH